MFTHFNQAEMSVHYPPDRRMYVSIKPYILIVLALVVFGLIAGAWLQYLLFGLPADPAVSIAPITSTDPVGFPVWLNISHWVNFFFLILIIRSGLSVLVDHPRLYWNNGCTPGTEWIRFTPLKVPDDKVWTAKEDARYISPVLGLPGYKHTIGIARVWHFLTVPFFLLNGAVFIVLLFCTNQWKRLVPVSWKIFADAWNVFVHYATFNMPDEPNGFYHYNAIQQLSYFGVVFILAPLAMLTGMAMSPAIENRFHWYLKLFGNRQSARSIHFLVMIAYVIFTIIHVSLVAATGLTRNMNHITIGTDSATNSTGLLIGTGIILAIIAFCFLAHWLSWNKQRFLQYLQAVINGTLWRITVNRFKPQAYYQKKDISPFFGQTGKCLSQQYGKSWQQITLQTTN